MAKNKVIATIFWTVDDLKYAFKMRGIKCSAKNIETFLSGRDCKTLEERSVEEGWTILRDLVGITDDGRYDLTKQRIKEDSDVLDE